MVARLEACDMMMWNQSAYHRNRSTENRNSEDRQLSRLGDQFISSICAVFIGFFGGVRHRRQRHVVLATRYDVQLQRSCTRVALHLPEQPCFERALRWFVLDVRTYWIWSTTGIRFRTAVIHPIHYASGRCRHATYHHMQTITSCTFTVSKTKSQRRLCNWNEVCLLLVNKRRQKDSMCIYKK